MKKAEKTREPESPDAATQREHDRLQRILAEQREANLDQLQALNELAQDNAKLHKRLGEAQHRLLELAEKHAYLKQDHDALRQSLSWRLTAPVRAALSVLPTRWFSRDEAQDHTGRNGPGPAPATRQQAVRKLNATALVIGWDIGHNALGRSYMVSDVLQRVFRHVVIAGFRFEQHGRQTWEPLRDARTPVIGLRARPFPEFLNELEQICERVQPDIVFACKPRLPSAQLGAMLRHRWGCPLVLDIDDHELTFFGDAAPISLDMLADMGPGAAAGETAPESRFWTRCAESLVDCADAVLVSNPALQKRFGGTLLPHVRDETCFDPAKMDRAALRERLGITPQAKVVLFFGTPRRHKGIETVARAVGSLADPKLCLLVVGAAPDKRDTAELDSLTGGRVKLLGNQPFSEIPNIVSVADVVCLPQDPAHSISRYQLPAKAIDAIAMGIPLLVSDTEPLRWLAAMGLARVVEEGKLAEALAETLAATPTAQAKTDHRNRFLEELSYASAANRLHALCEPLLGKGQEARRSESTLPRFLEAQRQALGLSAAPNGVQAASRSRRGKINHVLFWKQNDSGIYGRRVDMIARTLAAREDTGRVLLFDLPISEFDLDKLLEDTSGPTQNRRIYERTYEKLFGQADEGKLSHHVFAHPAGMYNLPHRNDPDRRPLAEGFIPFVESILLRENVIPQDAVFWFYPRFFLADALLEAFKPRRVVSDVVDDHRAWPGVGPEETRRLDAHYRSLLGSSDLTLVNCEPMAQKMKSLAGKDFALVENGCDSNPPAVPPDPDNREFQQLLGAAGPVIGYVGNLEAKIDVKLIAKLAEAMPESLLVLVGSTHASSASATLQSVPNIIMPGVVPYEQVGAWLQQMDVAILPHLRNRMTMNMNPLKLFVYLQWGLPVVSTDIPNIGYEGPFLSVADDEEAFIAAVRRFLEAPPRDEDKSLAKFIRENDWAARINPLMDQWLAPLKQ